MCDPKGDRDRACEPWVEWVAAVAKGLVPGEESSQSPKITTVDRWEQPMSGKNNDSGGSKCMGDLGRHIYGNWG